MARFQVEIQIKASGALEALAAVVRAGWEIASEGLTLDGLREFAQTLPPERRLSFYTFLIEEGRVAPNLIREWERLPALGISPDPAPEDPS